MKRIFFSVIALAVGVLSFTSCDDVPEPYNKPNYDPADEPVVVDPTGSGTVEDPFNISAANNYIANGGDATADVYVMGVISLINSVDTSYGNATYYISDDGKTTTQLEVYRGYYKNGEKFTAEDQIQVGDTVIVCGKLVNYNGTYEFTQGSKIVYQNGTWYASQIDTGNAEGTGTEADPYNIAAVLQLYANNSYDSNTEVYVKGTVSQIQSIDTGNYGNATYYLSDDGTTNNQYEIYRGYYLEGAKFTSEDQLKVGDVVVVRGKLTMYNTTKEMAQGSAIVSINGNGGGTTTGGDGTAASPYNVAQIISAAKAMSESDKKENVYVTGTISEIKEVSTSYGNASYYISDDGTTGTQFYIFRGYYLDGAKFTSADQIKVGQKVTITGTLVNYKGNTPEMSQGNKIVSIGDGGSTGTFTGLSEDFSASQGSFTIENISMDESLTYVWQWNSSKYMRASAYKNKKNLNAQSRLVSPAIDFSAAKSATLTFDHAAKFFSSTPTNDIKVQVSTDGSTWTDLTIDKMPSGNDWTFVTATIDLSAYAGQKTVYIGFLYTSTTTASPTWEVKNFVVK